MLVERLRWYTAVSVSVSSTPVQLGAEGRSEALPRQGVDALRGGGRVERPGARGERAPTRPAAGEQTRPAGVSAKRTSASGDL